MIDHIGIAVSNYQISTRFYQQVLAPLGYYLDIEVSGYAGFKPKHGMGAIANFWLHQATNPSVPLHIAFGATNRETVDAFYQAALAAGGTDNGAPGIRAVYHRDYYSAFVLDPDGHNIEAVCHHQPDTLNVDHFTQGVISQESCHPVIATPKLTES